MNKLAEYKRITIRLSTTLADDLKVVAKQRGTTLTGIIRQILFEWLENHSKEEK